MRNASLRASPVLYGFSLRHASPSGGSVCVSTACGVTSPCARANIERKKRHTPTASRERFLRETVERAGTEFEAIAVSWEMEAISQDACHGKSGRAALWQTTQRKKPRSQLCSGAERMCCTLTQLSRLIFVKRATRLGRHTAKRCIPIERVDEIARRQGGRSLATLIDGADRASAAFGMDLAAMRPEITSVWNERS